MPEGFQGRRAQKANLLGRKSLCAWVVAVVLVLMATVALPALHGRAHTSIEGSHIRNPAYDARCPRSQVLTIENCRRPQTSQEPENRPSQFSDLHAPD
jgi:hypothetical protein